MSNDFIVVIPARFASTRLPGKALLDINGKSLVQRVFERAVASSASRVIVATDDPRVSAAAAKFGAAVLMTSTEHTSGTERIAEVITLIQIPGDTIVVNVQGDEPMVPPANIDQVARNLYQRPESHIATLCEPIESDTALFDPNVVKVVMSGNGMAHYFSRAPIPWHRDHLAIKPGTRAPGAKYYRHIGIYAYRAGYVLDYTSAPASALEQAEALEQLRALETGSRIHVELAMQEPGPGVDTPADLELARRLIVR